MTAREKLIELLRVPIYPHELADPAEVVADYLLDNGVTIQKWISVAERLPNKEEYTTKTEDGTAYYARLLIAYKTDITEFRTSITSVCTTSLPKPPVMM